MEKQITLVLQGIVMVSGYHFGGLHLAIIFGFMFVLYYLHDIAKEK